MAKTSLTVLPKKTGPSDALKSMSIANSPKAAAKNTYINTVASSPSATSPVRDPNFASKVSSIEKQALHIQDLINQKREEENRPKTNTGTPSPSLKEMSSALSPRTPTADYYGKARSAMEEYIKSLTPTDEENKLSKNLSNLRSSISSGVQLASEQAIPMGFITGQQQSIENRGINAIQPFQDELERLFQEREAKSKGLSARQGFETALADTQFEDARYQDQVARDERRYAYGVAQKASEPIEFGGSLYQRNPDGGFTEVLSAPPEVPKPFELSEGQSRYEYNPKTGQYEMIASKGKTYAPGTGSSLEDKPIALAAEDKRALLGGGWSQSEISALQQGVRDYGLEEVLRQEKEAGASKAKLDALRKAYGAAESATESQFLNKDYFRQIFGDTKLKEAAKKAGKVTGADDWIPFNEAGDTEAYLTQLEQTVNLYRQAGYTDKEILKMMQ